MYYKIVKGKDTWTFTNWKDVQHFLYDVLDWSHVVVHKIIQNGDFYKVISKKSFRKSYSFKDY